jgi:squalene-hopene/tetraprenyl-beta-curcumene cyclase
MFTLSILVTVLSQAKADSVPATPAQARPAIERGLTFLEKEGADWIIDRKCVSCHHVGFMLWAQNEARERGFTVDVKKIEERTRWALESKHYAPGGTGANPVAWLLLGKPATAGEQDEAWSKAADHVLKQQKPNATWDPPGQFNTQKRPAKERLEIVTSWVLLALAYDKDEERIAQSRERALEFLKKAEVGVSTESLALRVLLEHRSGDAKTAEARIQELLEQQNADGGWNWLRDAKTSDAFATGQVLYALGTVGVDVNNPAIQRARTFLLQTQREDGSWLVKSIGISNGNPAKIEERDGIYSYWGSAWATLGLLRTLPKD